MSAPPAPFGPVSVVTSRVRRRDGGLYEEKIIVQHRLTGATRDLADIARLTEVHPELFASLPGRIKDRLA